WLRQCLDQHSHCKINHPTGTKTPLPTRLINIDQFDNPFLEETNAQTNGPYIVLSYAWGDGKRVLTTKSNYQGHKQGLPVQKLPQTFADAIKVARGLNYRYIWIDAFCIIQDDKQDLARELPKMGDIYRYAVLTIYGEGAQSAHTGLFVNRDPYMYRPCKVSKSISTESASLQKEVTLATTCNGPDYLSPRGWILQERILSSRCLMFGKQMSWICSMGEAQETRPRLRLSLYTAIAANKSSRDFRSLSKQFDIWYVMVESYSEKELSFISDNLNAVSGLAALFHQAHSVTYAVGLWKEDIPLGLAWYVRLNDKRPVSGNPDGPSWTWASVGKVRIKFRSCARISSPAPQVLVEVIDITYDTISTLNPYGSVSKGVLHLHAPLKKAIL
ncbi:heterokaryon incompatibility protein-domain-containing protein, partial [Ilyonectria sp. MPI-CAGE-AT-0026]